MAEPAPAPSSPAVRRLMQGNTGRDTRPEVALRAALHAAGVRFRKEQPPLRGVRRRADVVIRKYRLAVFLDGCFWHGCPEHYRPPRTNPGYWAAKVERNRDRDADTDRRLREAGWTVMRVWEHEDASDAAQRVREFVHHRRATRPGADPGATATAGRDDRG